MKASKRPNIKGISTFAAVVLAATSLACATGEDEGDATHAAICVDAQTEVRVDDDKCDDDESNDGHTHMVWWYYPISYQAPAVGSSVKGTGGVTTRPAGATFVSKYPPSGGFGGKTGVVGG